MTDRDGVRGGRRRRRLATLPRRLVAGVLIGIGTIVGAKGAREQHWSIPPTVVDDGSEQGGDAGGEGDDAPGRLPRCA